MIDNSHASLSQGEIKFVSIGRVSDSNQLLYIPSQSTKKAYADEVTLFPP